ncbi:MAG: hypothetical protein GXP55_12480 [Deltaproteobacteria bacterium]|nr:hypothetical protein [Deltaproteobacteria bacterium]
MPRDEALYTACAAAMTHARECGEEVAGDPCEVFSRIERHAMVPRYQCVTDLPCGTDATSCNPDPNEELARTLEEAMMSRCGEGLNPDWRGWVVQAAAWMRPDAVASLERCAGAGACASYTACLDAWAGAVSGATPPTT